MKLRVALGIVVLGAYAAVHGFNAVHGYGDQPVAVWLTAAVFSLGDAVAVYGLWQRRYWARLLGLGIAIVALTEIAAMGTLIAITPALKLPMHWWLGAGQVVPFLVLLMAMLGPSMRAAFDEAPSSPWRFDSGLARLTRAALVAGVGAIPMLFLMAATSSRSPDDTARIVAAGAGVSLAVALYLLLRARTAGLPLAALSSVAGAWAAVRIVGSLGFGASGGGSPDWSSWQTVMAAACLIPGVVLGAGVFAAYLPRMVRFLGR
jgi:hypothetical protein